MLRLRVIHSLVSLAVIPATMPLFHSLSTRNGRDRAASVSGSAGDACEIPFKSFQDCLNKYGSDISKCQCHMDILNECRRKSESVMGA